MIAAVIVTYRPDIEALQALVSALSEQVNHLIVVDNSGGHRPCPPWFSGLPNTSAHWLAQASNIGIAAAHNIGIERAAELSSKYVILFDQDSHVSTSLIDSLVSESERLEGAGVRLACIGPRPFCLHEQAHSRPRVQKELKTIGNSKLVRQIIASGMLIPLAAFKDIGPKEVGLFIDAVDHEWCWRAADKGYSVAIFDECEMPHRLGDSRGNVLGMTYKVGQPVRLYYQFRNILLLSTRTYVPAYWKARNLLAIPLRFTLMCLFEPPRRQRFAYMLKGIWHGLIGKSGKLE